MCGVHQHQDVCFFLIFFVDIPGLTPEASHPKPNKRNCAGGKSSKKSKKTAAGIQLTVTVVFGCFGCFWRFFDLI